jgi:Cytochrome c oxidase subunit IV
MRTNALIFYGITTFFVVADIVYWFTSKDPTGTTALAFSVALAFLIGYYLHFTSRRLPAQPEDLPEAEIEDGAGELGFFSPHSPWPIAMGASAATMMLGFVFGWWLTIIGAGLFLATSLGLVLEYYVDDRSGDATPSHFHS